MLPAFLREGGSSGRTVSSDFEKNVCSFFCLSLLGVQRSGSFFVRMRFGAFGLGSVTGRTVYLFSIDGLFFALGLFAFSLAGLPPKEPFHVVAPDTCHEPHPWTPRNNAYDDPPSHRTSQHLD